MKRLGGKLVCPCCTAQALAFNSAAMAKHTMGSARAIEMFEFIIARLREDSVPAPDPLPSTETH
jgi:hypothetical protein